ncbi:MAG: hypothetical protein BWK73_47350 [Thiothrix lacustris]|uniref:Uncharacterized protein n=1 Tax=Thiothrix lacustris TaxID=525917 RepID=A0A1Y1Q9Y5_9GAMM|nr:MAG: hypothetical protein BWK73_47350 [Thiothrix lacustris]
MVVTAWLGEAVVYAICVHAIIDRLLQSVATNLHMYLKRSNSIVFPKIDSQFAAAPLRYYPPSMASIRGRYTGVPLEDYLENQDGRI